MWKNVLEPNKPQTIQYGACSVYDGVPKATNTRSEHLIMIAFHSYNGYTNAPQCYIIRTLPDLFEMTDGFSNMVKWIKGQRISWLGHLERMEGDRMPKKIFTQELKGTRRRPRRGWREEVERDLQVLGVRRWRELVTDRTKWRDIFRQAKAHSGL